MMLTAGEKLLILRKREGLSQEDMALVLGISRTEYGRREREDGNSLYEVKLTINEHLCILRRRTKITQELIAEELGLSRFWVNQMEQGKAPCEALKRYWKL